MRISYQAIPSFLRKAAVLTLFLLLGIICPVSAAEQSDSYERFTRAPQTKIKGNGKDQVTIMIYMNGSDLESEDNEATTDLKEMIKAGSSENVNVIVQTMGTKKWSKDLGIASNRSQTYKITGNGLKLLRDDLGQLDCTSQKTFQEFVSWTAANYPANRYILLFWNHGAGSVYGFGYDEYRSWNDSLTMDEIQGGLRNAGITFDFIGMDCCIMSNLEVCCALYDFCDYVVLSEDFESGLGWYYTRWLKQLYKNPSVDTVDLAKTIIDDMVEKNEDSISGGDAILSLIDEGQMKILMTAWTDFAYSNEKALTGNNYSQKRTRSGPVRVHPKYRMTSFFNWWLEDDSESDDPALSDYYVTDIMAVAQNIDSPESAALSSALSNSILYTNSTSGNKGLTGLAVTLPYGDADFYSELKTVFTNCGLDSSYVQWLKRFVNASGKTDYYDYEEWDEEWTDWEDYDDDYDWDLWSFFFGDESDEYWEDEENFGWAEDDYNGEGGLLGFFNWLLSDEDGEGNGYYDNEDDYNGEDGLTGFFNWLLSDEDDEENEYYDNEDDYGILDLLLELME